MDTLDERQMRIDQLYGERGLMGNRALWGTGIVGIFGPFTVLPGVAGIRPVL